MTSDNHPVIFCNKGLIDIRSIYTFGVSSKDKDNAIGFFGTGLKYAIAILLRHDCAISIFVGKDRFDFGTEATKIRNDEFKIVKMNGQPLGFTTELGKTWELWQAFRELYCNTKDENGVMSINDCAPIATDHDHTVVAVWGSEFRKIAKEMNKYILPDDRNLIFKSDSIEALPGPSKFVYYRGVRAYELPKPTYFTYNITEKLELTEDRTIKFCAYINYYLVKSIAACKDKTAIATLITLPENFFESGLSFENAAPSLEFHDTVISLVRQFKGVNRSAAKVCQASILDALAKVEPTELSVLDQKKMEKAISFCKKIGHPVDKYPIIVTNFLGEGVLGRACVDTIYISNRTVMMGTKQIAATILEEYLHLEYKLVDETYAMQNFLFDMIIGLGEQLTQEPL